MKQKKKDFFFALTVEAPWPEKLPVGRLLDEQQRHCTLAFLGKTHFPRLIETLNNTFPTPSFNIGLVGKFDQCLFLPKKHPHVAAWHIQWLEDSDSLIVFQKLLIKWLQDSGFPPYNPEREFLPHVTLCRSPYNIKQWKKSFYPLPLMTSGIHLYESLGHSKYQSKWYYPLTKPFEEIEHTADIAFEIRGSSLQAIHRHAFTALAFRFPPLLNYFRENEFKDDLEDIVISLNELIGKADQDQGCPYKAVSFHGDIVKEDDNTLMWEMIVDV